jgi:hypothetical protein
MAGWRFKIELTFRTLLQLFCGFSYRFWLKAMPPNAGLSAPGVTPRTVRNSSKKCLRPCAPTPSPSPGDEPERLVTLPVLVSYPIQPWLSHRAGCLNLTTASTASGFSQQ